MNDTHVSVAMATCNGEAYVGEQLASIAAQVRLPCELVVCDDASDDATVERIEAFAASAPFSVRLERNARRLGATANFERALSLCRGDLIFLADQDDVWLPDKVALLAGMLDDDPELGAVFCNADVCDGELRPLGYDLWQALGFTAAEQRSVREGRAHEVFARHVVAAGTGLAFRRRFGPLLQPFPDLLNAHDAWIAALVCAVARVRCVEQPLIRYRLHARNQIGLRRFDWRGQLRQARRQVEVDAFDYAVRFFEAVTTRLRLELPAGDLRLRESACETFDAKLAHARRRSELPGAPLARLPRVLDEALRGGYRRYSYGWKSVAQDLFLR